MHPRQALDGRAVFLMTLLGLVWSLQQVSLKMVARDVGPMLMVALRSVVAAALLALLMWRRGELPRLSTGRWRAGVLVGSLFAFEYLLVAAALRLTHAGHVVLFLYTAPVFAALGLAFRLPDERLHTLQWVGIGLALAGIAWAFAGPGAAVAGAAGRHVLAGDAMALAAGAAWGATTVAIRCSRLGSAPATETLMYQLLGAVLLLLPAAWLSGQGHFEPTPAALLHLAFQSLVVSFASFLVWFRLLRRYLASRLGVFSFLTPVFGVALGSWLLSEPLEPGFVAGGSLVLLGIVLVSGFGWLRAAWPFGRPRASMPAATPEA